MIKDTAYLFKCVDELRHLMDPCVLCPRQCGAERLKGQKGFCGLGDSAVVARALVHFGEEPPITGRTGSGTVFFSGCNGACMYCQNYQISRLKTGSPVSEEKLAEMYLELQAKGVENINWVTPTPHLPFAVKALAIAAEQGFHLPVVYNTNGYLRVEILKLLEGIVDIYLPDVKYGDNSWAEQFSQMPQYVEISRDAIREMTRLVGPLRVNEDQVAEKGVLIRHLVLPQGTAGTKKVFEMIADLNPRIPVSIMAQYSPCHQALDHPVLGRRITAREYREALDAFELAGLITAFGQDISDLETKDGYFPDFNQTDSEKVFLQNK